MKGFSGYGWAAAAALLLHGALLGGLQAVVRWGASEPTTVQKPMALQVLILPDPEPQDARPHPLPSRPQPKAVVVQPAAGKPTPAPMAGETVKKAAAPEAIDPPGPPAQPEVRPPPQASQVPEAAGVEAALAASDSSGAPEAAAAMGKGEAEPSSVQTAFPVGSRGLLIEARPLSDINPLFPLGSRLRGEQGDVRLQVWISADGKPERTQILKTSGYPALDASAERAVKKARFAPRRIDGSPVPGTLTIRVRFRLDG